MGDLLRISSGPFKGRIYAKNRVGVMERVPFKEKDFVVCPTSDTPTRKMAVYEILDNGDVTVAWSKNQELFFGTFHIQDLVWVPKRGLIS